MKRRSVLGLSVLGGLLALTLVSWTPAAFGAPVYLINSSAFGTSWDLGANWSDGLPAHPGDAYHVGQSPTNKSLRTPNDVNNPVFPGDSLTIHATGGMSAKHIGTATISDLILDGGRLTTAVGNRPMGYSGTLTVLSASQLAASGGAGTRTLVINSQLTSSGGLTVTGDAGTGTIRLTGTTNTYTGNWTISSAGLEAQGAGSLGSGDVTVNSGARIDVDYDVNNSADWTLDGLMVLDQNHTLGNLTIGSRKIADGTYSFADLNGSYNGNFVDGGSGSITVTGGGGPSVYELNKSQPYGNSWNTGADWTNTADSSTGVVPGLGTIANVEGRGLRTPMASGTFTFWATLNLKAGSTLGLKTTGTAALYDGHLQGGTLSMSHSPNGTASIGGNIAVDSNSAVNLVSTGSDHRTIILSADLSGSGDLDVYGGTGYGTLRLTGDNSGYSGDWLVRDYAILQAQSAGSLGPGNIAVNSGARIDVDYDISNTADWSLGGTMVLDQNHSIGALTVAGDPVATGSYPYAVLNLAYDANFADGGSGSITVTSGPIAGGTVYELNTSQPYGTNWNAGAHWTNTSDLTTGVVPPLGTIANVQGKTLRTPTSSDTFRAELHLQSGGALLLKTSGTATLVDAHLEGGTFSQGIAANSTGTIAGNISVDNASTINLNSNSTDQRTLILAANLSGSGGLTVDGGNGTGTGTLRLTGDNSAYSGDWLVRDAVMLQARSDDALGTGSLTLNDSTLAPGAPIGTADVGTNFTMNAGTLEIQINGLDQGDQGTPDGIGYDFVTVGGNAVLDGDLLVRLIGGFEPGLGDTFDVLQVDGNWSGDLIADPYGHLLGDPAGAHSWAVTLLDLDGGGHILRLTAVPEPSGLALAVLGLAGLALIGLRRRKKP